MEFYFFYFLIFLLKKRKTTKQKEKLLILWMIIGQCIESNDVCRKLKEKPFSVHRIVSETHCGLKMHTEDNLRILKNNLKFSSVDWRRIFMSPNYLFSYRVGKFDSIYKLLYFTTFVCRTIDKAKTATSRSIYYLS